MNKNKLVFVCLIPLLLACNPTSSFLIQIETSENPGLKELSVEQAYQEIVNDKQSMILVLSGDITCQTCSKDFKKDIDKYIESKNVDVFYIDTKAIPEGDILTKLKAITVNGDETKYYQFPFRDGFGESYANLVYLYDQGTVTVAFGKSYKANLNRYVEVVERGSNLG